MIDLDDFHLWLTGLSPKPTLYIVSRHTDGLAARVPGTTVVIGPVDYADTAESVGLEVLRNGADDATVLRHWPSFAGLANLDPTKGGVHRALRSEGTS